jgi:hypothetical protein
MVSLFGWPDPNTWDVARVLRVPLWSKKTKYFCTHLTLLDKEVGILTILRLNFQCCPDLSEDLTPLTADQGMWMLFARSPSFV